MKNVLLLLADGFELFEASAFIDVLGWNLVEGDGSTKLFSCGLTKDLTSTFGQKITVDFLIDEINVNDYDALAIPGGFEQFHFYEQAFDSSFLEVIKSFDERKNPIASICTGALPIAKSGILTDRKATTYNQNEVRQNMLMEFGAEVVQKPIVIDGNIITSWNPSTAIDVAFQLLEILTSSQNTQKVRQLMGFD